MVTSPSDRKIDGYDIWPLLAGTADESPYEAFYFYRGLNLQAVREGDWKLHLEKGELYNLAADIGESTNVASDNPAAVARLRKLAEAMQDDLGLSEIGPGCRPLGKVEDARPLIDHEGNVRPGFESD